MLAPNDTRLEIDGNATPVPTDEGPLPFFDGAAPGAAGQGLELRGSGRVAAGPLMRFAAKFVGIVPLRRRHATHDAADQAGAVDAAINAAVSDARLLITAFGAEISTDDQKSKAQAITATLDLLAQDPQKTHFIAYDPDLAPAPAPTAFKSAN